MNKKGAINLSINMIIVLILAIIILGFALNFVTDMFRRAEVGLSGQFPTVDIPVNSEHPIGIGEEFMIKQGEVRRISIKVLNNQNSNMLVEKAESNFRCGTDTSPRIQNMEEKEIPQNQVETLKMVVEGLPGMKNNAICEINIGDGTNTITQSFFLNTN